MGGSTRFMAPEMTGLKPKSQLNGKKIDMWASGVTLYNLLTKRFPFEGKSLATLKEQLRDDDPQLDFISNPQIRSLLSRLLEKDPERRPLTIDILTDPWLTRNGKEPIDLNLSSFSSFSSNASLLSSSIDGTAHIESETEIST